jgi:DNA polymerase I
MDKIFLIIDANSLLHRAYHALPPLTDAAGNPAGALYGVSSMLLKIIREISPEYAIAAFDRPEPTFREKEYSPYKEHRPEASEDLVSQLIVSKEFFEAFGISCLDCPGFEGDDIIGAAVSHAFDAKEVDKIIVLSGDLDVLQLVSGDRVAAWIPQKGISSFTEYGPEEVVARLGVPPERVPDYKGLVGDSSDNIPGVSGVGPKTAAALIQKYGPLEDLYALSPEPKTSVLQKVIDGKETALLSKHLATILRDIPVAIPPMHELKVNFSPSTLAPFLLSKGFRNLADRVNRS